LKVITKTSNIGGNSGGGGGGGGGGVSSVDVTPPNNVSGLKAIGADKQVILNWVNPSDSDFVRVLIVKKEGTQPTSRTDGTVIYDGKLQQFTDTNLDNSKTYYYAFYTYDTKPNYSNAEIVSVKPEAGKISIPITAVNAITNSTTSININSGLLTGPFSVGMKSDQVKLLQQILSQDTTIYPEGLTTGYYGSLTTKAVKAFQAKYGLTVDGIAGPKTRGKINEVFGLSQ
jgi:hypothetical protein